MRLHQLQLVNFRNYDMLNMSFSEQVVIFRGANAQGKTNLLEAIHMLALGKSHRTNRERDCIRWGEQYSLIKAVVERIDDDCRLEIQLMPRGKKVRRNGVEQRRLSDYIGTLRTVLFAPEDLSIVKGSPGKRRRFLDIGISQMSPTYLHHLSQFYKILTQRNQLLKQFAHSSADEALLSVLTEQLIDVGTYVFMRRNQFIKKLESWAREVQAKITNGEEQLSLSYQSFVNETQSLSAEHIKKQYAELLRDRHSKERERGITLVGPHLDDISFKVNGIDVQTYGSQGQQRTVALALKLAEIQLIFEETGDYPILLLDDVLSELDSERQTQLIHSIQQKVQTFVTTTSTEGIDLNIFHDVCVYEVEQGKVR